MAINSKQQAKVITKNTHTHTTTTTPETATAKFQHYVNDSVKYISNLWKKVSSCRKTEQKNSEFSHVYMLISLKKQSSARWWNKLISAR